MTAYALKGDRERCLAADMVGHISNVRELNQTIDSVLRSRERHRHAAGPAAATPVA